MGVTFTYEPRDGSWAACAVEDGGFRVEWVDMRLSDDVLRDLFKAVASVLRGAPEAAVEFVDAPDCTRLMLAAAADGQVRLVVQRFPEWPVARARAGTVIFDRLVRLRTLAGSVRAAGQAVLRERGEEGYRDWRGIAFPAEALDDLGAALRA